MAQHTIDLPCIADTYIDSGNPNTNYGNATLLNAGGEQGSSSPYRYYALFKFDWTSLPTRKKFINAKVRLYSAKAMPSVEGCGIGGSVNQRDFDESTVTYNNYGSKPTSHHIYYSGASLAANTWYEFDMIYFTSDYLLQHEKLINYGLNFIWIKRYSDDNPDFWQIQSREGANPPVLRVTYEDVPPSAPTPIDPIGAYKDNKSIIRFAWQYNSDVGGTQKAFDLQWSTDQANWTTVSLTTANNYYDMPADTLPAGNIYWRVRTYNEYDEVGPYCDIQSFYAIGALAAPVLNAIPTNTARPVVSWSAFSQQVYQLLVLSGDTIVYDSGIVPGISVRNHRVMAWLADGEYTVQLRIKNEYDLWSEWGSASVTISTAKPAKPTLTAQKTLTGIKLTVPVGRMLIYRDGICIGETSTGEYIDNAVANGKEYTYIARAVEGYPEREIINLLGDAGDCEDISKWTSWRTTISLDPNNKVFGNNSIKVVLSTGYTIGSMYINIANMLVAGRYYMLSGYLKNGNAASGLRIRFDSNDGDVDTPFITDTAKFVRTGVKVSPRNYTGTLITLFVQGTEGQYGYFDGVLLTEITEEEYNSLTIDQLLAKYPFGNGTFIAPCSETFTDSDPVTATAEFKNAHIAPVSGLTDIFTFTRSLNAPPKRTLNHSAGGSFVEYAGRKHPVWEPTEHVSAAWLMSFFLKEWDDVEELIDLIERKETVLYRDARGRKIYGVLGNLTVNDERSGYTVGFTLTEVDHIEEVEA